VYVCLSGTQRVPIGSQRVPKEFRVSLMEPTAYRYLMDSEDPLCVRGIPEGSRKVPRGYRGSLRDLESLWESEEPQRDSEVLSGILRVPKGS
jgi:hypothetical protein